MQGHCEWFIIKLWILWKYSYFSFSNQPIQLYVNYKFNHLLRIMAQVLVQFLKTPLHFHSYKYSLAETCVSSSPELRLLSPAFCYLPHPQPTHVPFLVPCGPKKGLTVGTWPAHTVCDSAAVVQDQMLPRQEGIKPENSPPCCCLFMLDSFHSLFTFVYSP